MKKILSIFVVAFGFGFMPESATAQCDSIANICNKNISKNYISDGQSYRALLNNQEIAEFKTVFYGGSTYRISGCSGFTDGNLVFSVFDQEKNLLFTNADQKNAPYWDLKFASTLSTTIEAQLFTTNQASGCAVMLIGFK